MPFNDLETRAMLVDRQTSINAHLDQRSRQFANDEHNLAWLAEDHLPITFRLRQSIGRWLVTAGQSLLGPVPV